MKGFIYVLSNPSLSSVKIGKTKADPTQRSKELTQSTSIPTAFELEYSAYVDDFNAKELEIHFALETYRVNKNREFFDVTVEQAISTIEELCTIRYAENLAAETIPNQKIIAPVDEESVEKNDGQEAIEEASDIETVPPSQSYLRQIIHEGNGWRRGSFSFDVLPNVEVVPVYEPTIRSWLFAVLVTPFLAFTVLTFLAGVVLVGMTYDELEASDFLTLVVLLSLEVFVTYCWMEICGGLLKVDFSKLRRPKV